MHKLASIVVGVDFSACSAAALAQATRIAAWTKAKVSAVHVVDTLVVLEVQEVISPIAVEIQDELSKEARAAWSVFTTTGAAKNSGAADIPFDVTMNNASAELTKRARQANADLLVLGAHGIAHEKGVGMVASQLVRYSPCDVLLVQDGKTGPFKQVLACVDFSETSRDALKSAIRIAAQDGAQLHVLHVVKSGGVGFLSRRGTPSPTEQAQRLDKARGVLEEFCRPFEADVQWAKPRFEVVEAKSHGAGITDYAKSSGCDLLVLGTRGKTNLRDVLLGSTAERVLRDAPASILAIRPKN